ncbi:AMP-binding protein [Paraburkholderia domus]|uniref:AMP-binding protein n=1 Tax=Paraburkholderia domus TaxID=2793075 RepID=UPI001B8D874D|nr:AMP-binding protein [Paraburkholderia domus]
MELPRPAVGNEGVPLEVRRGMTQERAADTVGAVLAAVGQTSDARRCLLFGHRSVAAYVGVLGILDARMAYVKLSPEIPATRIAAIIMQSGAPLMLVDRRSAGVLEEVLSLLDCLLLDERPDISYTRT